MRHILVDAVRGRGANKRRGDAARVNLDETAILSSEPDRSIPALDEALMEFSQLHRDRRGWRAALLRRAEGGRNHRGFLPFPSGPAQSFAYRKRLGARFTPSPRLSCAEAFPIKASDHPDTIHPQVRGTVTSCYLEVFAVYARLPLLDVAGPGVGAVGWTHASGG
jgi:hypothetical protein